MIENTLLNKSGVRPAGERSRTGHSNEQQNNTNNNNEERERWKREDWWGGGRRNSWTCISQPGSMQHPSIYLSI